MGNLQCVAIATTTFSFMRESPRWEHTPKGGGRVELLAASNSVLRTPPGSSLVSEAQH